MKELIDRIIEQMVSSEVERAGCGDGSEQQIADWKRLAHSTNPADHDKLIADMKLHTY